MKQKKEKELNSLSFFLCNKSAVMKIFVKLAVLILLPSFIYGRPGDPYLDRLHETLTEVSNDTARMEACSNLGTYYLLANHDSSRFYFEHALSIATNLGLKLNEASILNNLGLILMYNEKFSGSLETFLKAINIAKDPKSEKPTWHLLPGQTPTKARLSVLSNSYDYIGLLNAFAGNWSENINNQLKNYREAERLAIAANDSEMIPLANLHMGIAYMNAGKLDSAIGLQRKALATFEHEKNQWGVGVSMKYLGDSYEKMGNFDSARYIMLQAIGLLEQTSDFAHGGRAYLSLSRIYMDLKNSDSSLYYGRKSLFVFEKLADAVGKKEAYNLLASHFDQLKNQDSATIYLKLAKTLSDSLGEEERKNLLAFQDVVVGEQIRLEKLEKEKIETRDRLRIFALISGAGVFMVVAFLLYRNNRHRKKANEVLQQRNQQIENTLNQLKSTQAQLIQSEKMASLGELTAGIAHEIQNPLNFVNNFSEVNKELIEEVKGEKIKDKSERNNELEMQLLDDIEKNLEKISHHGKRADAIVKGMLLHSKTSTSIKELTDINKLADEYLRLAYHGLRAKDKGFNAEIKTDFDNSLEKVDVNPQEIGRVLLNLINNAFYAVNEKAKQNIPEYQPTVTVTTKKIPDKILISVADNGNGIPQKIFDKIFQPFFTTKPTGQGTGLGLSLAYDIVKAHGGEIKVETKEGEGSEFVIQLPTQA